LFNQSTSNEIPQPASADPRFAFNKVNPSEFDGSSEAAISVLHELTQGQEIGRGRPRESRTYRRPWENRAPLQKVPPSEWRSLGGYFDYGHWAERDRFMELDKAIAAT